MTNEESIFFVGCQCQICMNERGRTDRPILDARRIREYEENRQKLLEILATPYREKFL